MDEVALELFVSSERLGSPRGVGARMLGRSRRPDEDRPTATCHLQINEEADALCGYEWEGLTRVPGNPTWTDIHPELRCDSCSAVVGIHDEDPKGRSYRYSL